MDISNQSLSRVIAIAAIVIVTAIATRVVGRFTRRSLAATGLVPTTSILVNIARMGVVAMGALAILAVLDISITPILTALGVGGLAVALALQDTLGNLFAGLQIVATGQIRPGDYLLLGSGQEGTVVDTAWRTTTLRTQSDNLVIVPNSVLAQAVVTNYRLPAEAVATTIEFGVGYDADLGKVETVVAEVARETMVAAGHDVGGRAPVVRFKRLAESHVLCAAVLYVPRYGDQFPVRSDFIKRLHARFAEEGIAFPYPAVTLHRAEG